MSRLRVLTAAAAIVSLVGASITAIAASPVRSTVSAPAATAAGSWGTLSAMSGSSAATAALLSDYDDRGGFGNVSWLSLAVILATIAAGIWIITRDDDDELDFNSTSPVPVSPN